MIPVSRGNPICPFNTSTTAGEYGYCTSCSQPQIRCTCPMPAIYTVMEHRLATVIIKRVYTRAVSTITVAVLIFVGALSAPSVVISLQWCHNGRASVSNHQPHDCLFNRLFRRRSKKTSKLRVTGLCAGNSPGTGEFPAQMASNAENVSIWWRHYP